MVRLVFRPYTQIWRSICTSESLRASTRVSPGFTLLRHSSPSFGSQQKSSYSNLIRKCDRSMVRRPAKAGSHLRLKMNPSLSLRVRVCHPNTRFHARLLGPCFKTGCLRPFRQDRLLYETSVGRTAVPMSLTPRRATFSRVVSRASNPSWPAHDSEETRTTLSSNTSLSAISGTF